VSRHRIEAAPSGEITLYIACWSISTRLAVASAIAPPEPPSPRITATLGTPEVQTGVGGAGDRLGLAAFFRVDARIGPRRVDERQHRDVEAVGHLHQPHRLAVAFRPRHAEIVLEPALGGGALLVPDHADALAAKAAEAADAGLVLAELAIAGKRDEFRHQRVDVVEAMRPLRMPGDLCLLPRRQLGVEV